jgi:hypothetical protein
MGSDGRLSLEVDVMHYFVLEDIPGLEQTPDATDFMRVDSSNMGDALKCTLCGQFISLLAWLPPHRGELEVWGRRFGDIVAGPSNGLLLSQRMRCLVEEHGIRGFEGFDPVEIVRVIRRKGAKVKGKPPPYCRVSVVRSRMAIDQAASGVEWEGREVCPECRQGHNLLRWQRVVLEPGPWLGEDVFEPRGFHVFMVSERFKNLCEEYQIANAVFIPPEDCAYDFYPDQQDAPNARGRQLLQHPLDGTVLERIKPNGEVWRYCPRTGELAVRYLDGKFKTFRPVDGRELWERE